jgi:hypothetical protein
MGKQIKGVDGLTPEMISKEVANGGRFLMFDYAISIIVMTFRRSSDIYFLRHDESHWKKSWPYTAMSALLGWWGFPWGFIYTPSALYTNMRGGRDVTSDLIRFQADRNISEEELASLEPKEHR